MIDIWPWGFFAVGVAAAIITAFFFGIEVGKDRVKRGGE